VVQVRHVVEVEVDSVRAGRAQLGQPGGHLAGGAGDAHLQHPGAGLPQGGGPAGGLVAGPAAADRQRGGQPNLRRITPGLLAEPAEVGEPLGQPEPDPAGRPGDDRRPSLEVHPLAQSLGPHAARLARPSRLNSSAPSSIAPKRKAMTSRA